MIWLLASDLLWPKVSTQHGQWRLRRKGKVDQSMTTGDDEEDANAAAGPMISAPSRSTLNRKGRGAEEPLRDVCLHQTW